MLLLISIERLLTVNRSRSPVLSKLIGSVGDLCRKNKNKKAFILLVYKKSL